MRKVRSGVLFAALIVLGAAHVAYWYWPRERPASLPSRSYAAGVLDRGNLPLRAWVAHPHQNLAFLSRESGRNWRRGLEDLLSAPDIDLPSFGPFAFPPASGMALASDEGGERLIAAARVYPAIALLSRAAGKVAGNPWLGGGAVERGERRFEVRWSGRVWMLRTPGEAWPESVSNGSGAAALARLEVDRSLGPVPPGSYRLVRGDGHLDLLSSDVARVDEPRPERGVLMMLERDAAGARATAVLGPGEGSLRGVPSAVSFAQRGAALPALPFQGLYRVLGVKRRRAALGEWSLVASDRGALRRGRELLPAIEAAAGSAGRQLAYSADLDVVRAVSAELERRLEGLPLPDLEELRRWRGAALLLRELAAYDAWSLDVAEAGKQVRVRLWRAVDSASGID